VLEPRLRLTVAAHGRLAVVARAHQLLQPAQLLLECEQVRCAGEDVLAQRQPALERRALVVQCDAGALLEDEVAALQAGLADKCPQERCLSGSVRAGKGHAVAPFHLEGDAVEQRVAAQLLAQVGCDHNRHEPHVSLVR
jgi:hypothetical protein